MHTNFLSITLSVVYMCSDSCVARQQMALAALVNKAVWRTPHNYHSADSIYHSADSSIKYEKKN